MWHLENFPVALAMALPFWDVMHLRSGKGSDMADTSRVIFRYYFRDDFDFQRVVGFLAVQLYGTSKVAYRFAKVCPTPLSPADEQALRASDELGVAGARGHPFNTTQYIEYEPAVQTLTLRVPVTVFNNSTPVAGASVEAPPDLDPAAGARKYVLSRGWVPLETQPPSPAELSEWSTAVPENPL